jgi:hypothetical protein
MRRCTPRPGRRLGETDEEVPSDEEWAGDDRGGADGELDALTEDEWEAAAER